MTPFISDAIRSIGEESVLNRFFDGAAQIIQQLNLADGDKRLAFTAPKGKGLLRVNINDRLVFSIRPDGADDEAWLLMINEDDLAELKSLKSLRQQGEKFAGSDNMLLCKIKTSEVSEDEWTMLLDRCIHRCKEYLDSRRGGLHQRHHLSELYKMAVDKEFRAAVIMKALVPMQEQLIDKYIQRVEVQGNAKEEYKWKILGKNHWDLDAPDLARMIKAIPFGNLVYPLAIAVLVELASRYPEEVRTLLRQLFEDSVPLAQRIATFKSGTGILYRRYEPKLNHHQDERSMASYLAFHDAEKYPLYKRSFYKKYCDLLGIKPAPSGSRYTHYIGLLKDFIEQHLNQDPETVQHLKSLQPSNSFADNELLLLGQDILYTSLDYDDQDQRPAYNEEEDAEEEEIAISNAPEFPLNTILYGPPGTGKTYNAVNYALAIIEGRQPQDLQAESRMDRSLVKNRFDDLLIGDWEHTSGQIGFITFHQSMSYEDFIEGIKPSIDENEEGHDQVKYAIVPGILKQLSLEAAFSAYTPEPKMANANRFLKFSERYDALINDINEKLDSGSDFTITTRTGQILKIVYISDNNNIHLQHRSGDKRYIVSKTRLAKIAEKYPDVRQMKNIDREVRAVIGGANGTAYYGVLDYIQHSMKMDPIAMPVVAAQRQYQADEKQAIVSNFDWSTISISRLKPYVLIIDEINRGNVSQIFGELITLIEQGKRAGQGEALSVTLPYSRERFSVPPNLYIIGTMNTADRSVEALDSALRRRFSFVEMPADPEVLEHRVIRSDEGPGEVDLSVLLQTINERIAWLKDKDHQIGHTYFLSVENEVGLRTAFKNSIIPLLQEYFYNDYSSIQLILGPEFVEEVTRPPAFAVRQRVHQPKTYRMKALPSNIVSALQQAITTVPEPGDAF